MNTAERVRASFPVPEIAEELGLEIEGDKAYCFLHDEHTPSLHLYEDHWYSYCCGKGGTVIDLVMEWFGCSFGRALAWFAEGQDLEDLEPRVTVERELKVVRDFTDQMRAMTVHPGQEHHEFAKTRWPYLYSHDWIPGVPVAGGLAFPHIHDGQTTGIKYRLFNGSKTSEPGSVFTVGLYRPYGLIAPDVSDRLVIAEGETDTWALQCHFGGSVVVAGLPSGASTWRDDWVPRDMPEVYVCMDNDKAGKEALERIVRSVGFDRARELKVPALYNDASEALAAGWSPTL